MTQLFLPSLLFIEQVLLIISFLNLLPGVCEFKNVSPMPDPPLLIRLWKISVRLV